MGKKSRALRRSGILPAVMYGPEIKNTPLELDLKEFKKIFKEAGASSLISLELGKEKFLTLVHEISHDPLTDEPTHVDFYQPNLAQEIEVVVPLIFEGEAKAVKDLGGTLIREIQEIKIKSLPQNLPHEIKVSVAGLDTFEKQVLVRDLVLPDGVRAIKDANEIVAKVLAPVKIEEELEKPIEEKVDEVEKVEKAKKETGEEGEAAVAKAPESKDEKKKDDRR